MLKFINICFSMVWPPGEKESLQLLKNFMVNQNKLPKGQQEKEHWTTTTMCLILLMSKLVYNNTINFLPPSLCLYIQGCLIKMSTDENKPSSLGKDGVQKEAYCMFYAVTNSYIYVKHDLLIKGELVMVS